MKDLRLKEFLEQDIELIENGATYLDAWKVLGHAAAVHYILAYYHDDLFYEENNEDIFHDYNELSSIIQEGFGDRECEINIFNIAGVYEYKRIIGSRNRFNKYFTILNYFKEVYVPDEYTPVPKLKENGVFITSFLEIVTTILPDFDVTTIRDCVLSFRNNYELKDERVVEHINSYIKKFENEVNDFISNIEKFSTNEIAYMTGKLSSFLYYDQISHRESDLVEAFFLCKSRLPKEIKSFCFLGDYLVKLYENDKPLGEYTDAYQSGMNEILHELYHCESKINEFCNKIKFSTIYF